MGATDPVVPLFHTITGFSRKILPGLLLLLLLAARAYPQDLQQRITIHANNRPVSEILKQISALASIDFSYNPATLPVDRVTSVDARNKPLREVLDEVLTRNGIGYAVVEKHIVLRRLDTGESSAAATITTGTAKFTISGFLKNKSSGEALIGANVYIRGTSTGVMTNGYGFYSLTLPGGEWPVVYSYLGFREITRTLKVDGNQRLTVEMEENPTEMNEVEVVSRDREAVITNQQMSEFRFSQKTLAQLPGFGGNLDIIRALQSVPGIQSFGDGSALYFVRGGASDQNLLLIDEVPVYNPSHLFGFFSAFAPDAINDVQVYKGDFPARFGGRLSSVIDIKAREGNMKRFGFSGNIGPYSSNLSVEGPVVRDRGSFILSGRISTINWINDLKAIKKTFDFRFFDLNAKLNFRLNDNNRIFLTFYTGQDRFDRGDALAYDAYGIWWNNLAGTFRWNHLFSSRLFSNTTFNYSRYNYELTLPEEQEGKWHSGISNLTLKTDLAWYLNPRNTIRTGLEVTAHNSDPGNVTLDAGSTAAQPPAVSKYHSMEYVFFASNEQNIGKKLTIRYGVRLPVWQDLGPASVAYFDANHKVIDTISYGNAETYSTAFSPEPRINIQYRFNDRSTVKASYSRSTQFLQLLSNSTSPFTSLEVWAPCGPNIPAQKADQVAAGYFRDLGRSRLTLSAEAYYKWFHDHLDYRDHANMLFNTLIEGELRFGRSWSYGLELMLRKSTGQLTGWIAYTWSRAFVQTPGVNGGNTYRAGWDRPNDVCVNLSWNARKHWTFTANWIYMTGAPVTMPTGFYYYNGYSVPVYGEKNNDRLPDYHRLDLSVSYAFNKPGNRYRHSLALTIYNAYGRMNPFSVNYNKMKDEGGEFVVPANLVENYRLVTTSISVAGIIPSINYQFAF